MNDSLTFEEYINRLMDRIGYHHDAAKLLFRTHKEATPVLMFAAASLNRSISLVKGFRKLIPDNYICAAPIVRLQLDNVLRFSALSLVTDAEDFATRVAAGEKIGNLKDLDDQQMKDNYLKNKGNKERHAPNG
jgi:hypothetical protein